MIVLDNLPWISPFFLLDIYFFRKIQSERFSGSFPIIYSEISLKIPPEISPWILQEFLQGIL